MNLDNVLITRRVARREIDKAFKNKGITLEDIATITYNSQKQYMPELTVEIITHVIDTMLNKDEVQDVVQTAISLDKMVEENRLPEPLNSKIKQDAGYFGLDELLVSAIYQLYGTVGVTNYGYIDKIKPSIIGDIDYRGKHTEETTTFLDDVVGALAGGACGYWAHHPEVFYSAEEIDRGLKGELPEFD